MKSRWCRNGIGGVFIALVLVVGCKRQEHPTAAASEKPGTRGPWTLGQEIEQIHRMLNATPAKAHWVSVAVGMQRLEGVPEIRSEVVRIQRIDGQTYNRRKR